MSERGRNVGVGACCRVLLLLTLVYGAALYYCVAGTLLLGTVHVGVFAHRVGSWLSDLPLLLTVRGAPWMWTDSR